MAYFDLTN